MASRVYGILTMLWLAAVQGMPVVATNTPRPPAPAPTMAPSPWVICQQCAHASLTHTAVMSASSSWKDTARNGGEANRTATASAGQLKYVCVGCSRFEEIEPRDESVHLRRGHWSMMCGKCGLWPEGSTQYTCKTCVEHEPLPRPPCEIWETAWCTSRALL